MWFVPATPNMLNRLEDVDARLGAAIRVDLVVPGDAVRVVGHHDPSRKGRAGGRAPEAALTAAGSWPMLPRRA
jgi:hypothetical protein